MKMTKEDFFKELFDALAGEGKKIKEDANEEKCNCQNCSNDLTDPNPIAEICKFLNDFYNDPKFRESKIYKQAEECISQLGAVDGQKYGIAKLKLKFDLDRIYNQLAKTMSELHQIRTINAVLYFQQEEKKKN
jgi:hypothetical protein